MAENVPDYFGSMVFNDAAMRARLPKEVYTSLRQTIANGKTIDGSIADTVACAMKDWAVEKGATHYTHWFQPLTSVTAEKHDAFIEPTTGDKVVMELSGKSLVKGESDASSFPSGGLRATCAARGYTAWDPSSYAFIKDGTLYIPTAFCSYTGESLDFKTPLLRSVDAVSAEALRILSVFGDTTSTRVTPCVGAEQEYFLVDKAYYDAREDLRYTGRTLFGAPAPRGQELNDHYYGPLKPTVSAFMHDLDRELWMLGVNSKTKHNEAAPSQYELAPIYGRVNMATDQNLLIMDTMRRVAIKHGLICLLHEKPYEGINGSGKHNNWSLSTDTGKNLFSPGENPVENTRFLLLLAAVVKAIDEYQDLLRMSVAFAENDHRLGRHEAPPAIVSMFVGEELEAIIDSIVTDHTYIHRAGDKMDLGISSVPVFEKDTTDRNRTSPFAFTGNKFEFRMLGSSQNIALPNVVLNTAVAKQFREFADVIEAAGDKNAVIAELIKKTFTEHKRIIFNGDGYSKEWEQEAERRGLSNHRTSVEAFRALSDPKNVALFTEFGVFSATEIEAREQILYEIYAKTVTVEAKTMLDMVNCLYLPAVEKYIITLCKAIQLKKETLGETIPVSVERNTVRLLSEESARAAETAEAMKKTLDEIGTYAPESRAEALSCRVIPMMETLRRCVDTLELHTDRTLWPVPTYGEMTRK